MNALTPPITPATTTDLHTQLELLQAEQLEMQRKGYVSDPALSDDENIKGKILHDARIQSLVTQQLQILADMRKTAAGPAKAGSRKAKRAPIDLAALEDSIFAPPSDT